MHREWCESGVLRTLRQRSLARLRREVEPVETDGAGAAGDGVAGRGCGRAPGSMRCSTRSSSCRARRCRRRCSKPKSCRPAWRAIAPADLDVLMGAGEVVWLGVEPLGDRDGRIALYLTDHLRAAGAAARTGRTDGARARDRRPPRDGRRLVLPRDSRGVRRRLSAGGRRRAVGPRLGGAGHQRHVPRRPRVRRPRRRGRAANARRARTARGAPRRPRRRAAGRSWRRASASGPRPPSGRRRIARQLLNRHGVLTREAVAAEGLRGGFSTVYEVLKTMEESGRIRRGLFVGGLGAMQFALPAALDLLRSVRDEPDSVQVTHLAATDPANPYGAILKWPAPPGPPREGRGPTRTAGATVILVNGRLAAYLARGDRQLSVYLPEEEPTRTITARAVAARLFALATVRHPPRHAHRAHRRGAGRGAPARAVSGRRRVRARGDGVSGVRDAPGTYVWASRRELTSAALVWFSVLGLGAVAETPNTDY